tara:strand:- start:223 stop:582 length:360 start_codon:yes stop_codon:yes gene_type:complete
MTIKVLVLKSGEDVIADVQEMMSSDNQVMGYFLTKPCVVKIQAKDMSAESEVSVRMHPWMPLAREKMIPLNTDWVVTMITPVEKIQEMYEKKVLEDGNETEETDQTTSSDEQSDATDSD